MTATNETATREKRTVSSNVPFRLVCFTIYDMDYNWSKLQESLQFYAYELEYTTTGRPHYQGYAYSGTAERYSWWMKLLQPHHWVQCRGSLQSNETYCSKDGRLIKWGLEPLKHGQKRQLLQVKCEIDRGEPLRKLQRREDCFEECIRYRRALKEYQTDVRLDAMYEAGFKPKTVHVYIGLTNCHKSRNVWDAWPRGELYSMPDNKMQWAGNYDGQPAVLFDDVGPGAVMSVTDFLRYCDGYPVEAPVKGGFVAWTPTHIYFTSNVHPSFWWPNIDPLQLAAVERRINCIRVYKAPDDYDVL